MEKLDTEMRISVSHTTPHPTTAVCTCTCVHSGSVCVWQASGRAGLGVQDPAVFGLRRCYTIGREGHIKLSPVGSPHCEVTACLHCCVLSSWKWYLLIEGSAALHGWAVEAVTFLLPGGDFLDSAAPLVWGLWCFFKKRVMPCCPSNIASLLFYRFSD